MARKRDPFRMSLKELEELQAKIRNHPLYDPDYAGQDLSPDGLLASLQKEHNYVVVAHDVPAPLDNIEPGSIILFTYNGMSARWLNGTVLVRRDILEQNKREGQ